jgi:hypothetical protein
LIFGTKLSSKITKVGSTNNNANQMPEGPNNINGSNHGKGERFFSFITSGSAIPSVALGFGKEGGVMLVDTGNYGSKE